MDFYIYFDSILAFLASKGIEIPSMMLYDFSNYYCIFASFFTASYVVLNTNNSRRLVFLKFKLDIL